MNQTVVPLPDIGFIGLGTMGAPMAANLLRAGYAVTVFNRSPERCRPLEALGAVVAASTAILAGSADVVLLMLPDDAAVRQVVLRDGVMEKARKGTVIIDSSTVHPDTSRELSSELGKRGIHYLDAPVTGSRKEAEKGELSFLIGGHQPTAETMLPIFETLGKKHFYLGESGMGACAKLGNNMMGAIHVAALSEAMSLVEKYGLERHRFLEIIRQSGARSAVVEGKGPKILAGDYQADFALRLMSKDARLAAGLANKLEHAVPVLDAAACSFGRAAKRFGDDDMCALYLWYSGMEQMAGGENSD